MMSSFPSRFLLIGGTFFFDSADSFGFPSLSNGIATSPLRDLIGERDWFFSCVRSVYAAGMVTRREIDREHECAIEEMPLGAELIAINNGDEWDNFTFPVRRIEVSDDTITLLSGYAGGYSKIGKSYAGEFNIKRGTKVRYRTK